MQTQYWLSIAIVVKDDEHGFARTWESLAAQDLTGVEIVVVDSSEDGSAIPSRIRTQSCTAAVTYQWVLPAGIYPAMNEALDVASGKYIYYLNAGDELFESSTVKKLCVALTDEAPLWAFGAVEIIETGNRRVITPPWSYAAEKRALFSRGKFPAHQGTVAQAEFLRRLGGFDTSYNVSADYACFLKMSLEADPLVMPFVLARFHEGGISTQAWRQSFREFHHARLAILQPQGVSAWRERWETFRHHALVYAHRELRPRLGLGRYPPK